VAESGPCPLDSCRALRAGGGSNGRAAGAVGALDAAVRERITAGGRGREVLVVVRVTVQRFKLVAFLRE
jgi:hypothetical protein